MKPYNELTYDEKLACISLYPEEAKKDEDWYLRREAYRTLGYTEEAKKDKDSTIRRETELYFAVKNFFNQDSEIIEVNGKKYQLIK